MIAWKNRGWRARQNFVLKSGSLIAPRDQMLMTIELNSGLEESVFYHAHESISLWDIS